MRASFLNQSHRELQQLAAARFESLEVKEPISDAVLKQKVCDTKLYGHLVPRAFGGTSERVSVVSLCVLREELAYRNAAADSLFAVHGLGSHPIVLMGNHEQQSSILSQVSKGECLFAFALTEANAGSDVGALETTAKKVSGGYAIDGAKKFISNAGVATHYTVFARTGPGPKNISAFVVQATNPGFKVTKQMELMGEHPIGEIEFTNCFVPDSALIGDEGSGMKLALGTLDVFRSTVGAAAVGMARRALDEAISYTKARKQFGSPLSELSAVQSMLAECAVELEAARLMVHMAAATKDSGQERITYEAAVAKLFATEAASRIIDRCLQVHGGNGVVKGFVVERLYRDIRALRIYEGASEVQRLVIARHILA
jgi:acyl-CoA dehydrogenase